MSAAAAAAPARRSAVVQKRHGGQRHQQDLTGSSGDKQLLVEAQRMLADGVCDVPLQKATPSLKCTVSATPNWSPASTACTDASAMEPLDLPVAAVDLEWPSMREAQEDWDFCSSASDAESSWVAEEGTDLVPETGVSDLADDTAYLVGSVPEPVEEETVPKRTFADALNTSKQGTGAPVASAGCRIPNSTALSKESKARGGADCEDEAVADGFNPRMANQGWKKQHKASRSTRHQRKLSQQTQRRAEQSLRTRGWLDDEEEEPQQDAA